MPVTKPTPTEIGQYYDTMAAFYQTLWGDSVHFGFWADPTDTSVTMAEAQQAFTDLMIAQLDVQPGQRVLDVGCGTGRPGIQLSLKAGVAVTGITVSQSQRDTAEANARAAGAANASFELVNAMELPYADNSFDAAWAFESFFHMPSRLQVLREMARVVKPGGKIVIADFVTIRPMTQEEIDIAYPAFAVAEIGSYADYIGELKAAGLVGVYCRDVTINTIHPSNVATLGALQTKESQDILISVYGEPMVSGMLGGWSAIQTVNETLSYIVVSATKPGASA
ncbi:methyltransferase domain-containing protein [Chloroflexia bacterium SDU3-3]|nr:methyltransferase domain-containing protein [Chloroflexia bacterium SDU3-3]